jgi:hypothetical protein
MGRIKYDSTAAGEADRIEEVTRRAARVAADTRGHGGFVSAALGAVGEGGH